VNFAVTQFRILITLLSHYWFKCYEAPKSWWESTQKA